MAKQTMSPPTPEELARSAVEDLAVCDKTTAGPWDVIDGANNSDPSHFNRWVGNKIVPALYAYGTKREENTLFASVAKTALPAWIRRAVQAEAEVARLKRVISYVSRLNTTDSLHEIMEVYNSIINPRIE